MPRRLLAMLLAYRTSWSRPTGWSTCSGRSRRTSAAATLQSYVSRVRRFVELGDDAPPSSTGRPATCSTCPTTWSTPAASSAGSPRARACWRATRITAGPELLDAALAEWRGDAFAEFADDEWIRPEAIRLDELRLVAVEALVDAELRVGRHQEVVGQLEAMLGRAPAAGAVRPPADARALPVGPAGGGAAGGAGVPHRAPRRPRPRAVGRRSASSRPRSSRSATSSRRVDARRRARGGRRVERRVATRCPPETTPLVGRDDDLELVERLLETGRILTLFGPGGVGKTRLARRFANTVAPTFADGVRLVELGPVRDEGAVPAAVAAALDVQQRPQPSLADSIVELLAPQPPAARARQLRARARHHERAGRAGAAVVPATCRCSPPAGSRSASRPRWCGRCRRCRCRATPTSRWPTSPRCPRCSCSSTGPRGPGRLRARRRQPARHRRDLHPARRRAARARAGGGAHALDERGRAGGAPPGAVPGAGRLASRHRSPAPHAARPRAVVLRPADAARAAPVRPVVGVRRELRARTRRAGVRGRRHRRARRGRVARRAGRQVDAGQQRSGSRVRYRQLETLREFGASSSAASPEYRGGARRARCRARRACRRRRSRLRWSRRSRVDGGGRRFVRRPPRGPRRGRRHRRRRPGIAHRGRAARARVAAHPLRAPHLGRRDGGDAGRRRTPEVPHRPRRGRVRALRARRAHRRDRGGGGSEGGGRTPRRAAPPAWPSGCSATRSSICGARTRRSR